MNSDVSKGMKDFGRSTYSENGVYEKPRIRPSTDSYPVNRIYIHLKAHKNHVISKYYEIADSDCRKFSEWLSQQPNPSSKKEIETLNKNAAHWLSHNCTPLGFEEVTVDIRNMFHNTASYKMSQDPFTGEMDEEWLENGKIKRKTTAQNPLPS